MHSALDSSFSVRCFVLNYECSPYLSSLMLMDRWRTEEIPQGQLESLEFFMSHRDASRLHAQVTHAMRGPHEHRVLHLDRLANHIDVSRANISKNAVSAPLGRRRCIS